MTQPTNTTPIPSLPHHYPTSDLGVAAYLVACEYAVVHVARDAGRATFIFPGRAREAAAQYYLPGSNLVDARRFHVALRDLRGLACEEERR